MTNDKREVLRDETLEQWRVLPPLSWSKTIGIALFFIGVGVTVRLLFSERGDPPVNLAVDLFLLMLLTLLVVSDVRHKILPDSLTLSLCFFGAAWNAAQNEQLLMPIVGAVIGFGIFYVIGAAWKARTGNTGLGLGDAKLLAGAGALLGPLSLPYIIMVSSGLAVIFTLGNRIGVRSEKPDSQLVVFGPFICAAIWFFWVVSPLQ